MADRIAREGNVLLVLFEDTSPESTVRVRETVEPSWQVILRAIEDLIDRERGMLHLVRIDLDRVGTHPRESWEHDAAHESKLGIGNVQGQGYLLHAEIREPDALPMYRAERLRDESPVDASHPSARDPAGLRPTIIEEAAMLQVVRTFIATGALDPVVTWVEEHPAWRAMNGS
jgi:hypothetical protein